MEGLALSVESPVLLSADSRRRLQLARKNLRESHTSSRYAHEGDDVDDVLERAYEEGGSHLR